MKAEVNELLIGQLPGDKKIYLRDIYGDLIEKYYDDYFRDRANLAPTRDDVHEVNERLIEQIPGKENV